MTVFIKGSSWAIALQTCCSSFWLLPLFSFLCHLESCPALESSLRLSDWVDINVFKISKLHHVSKKRLSSTVILEHYSSPIFPSFQVCLQTSVYSSSIHLPWWTVCRAKLISFRVTGGHGNRLMSAPQPIWSKHYTSTAECSLVCFAVAHTCA